MSTPTKQQRSNITVTEHRTHKKYLVSVYGHTQNTPAKQVTHKTYIIYTNNPQTARHDALTRAKVWDNIEDARISLVREATYTTEIKHHRTYISAGATRHSWQIKKI